MTGLVLEGGAFRCLFTAGVLDGLLEIEADIRYIIGVSAGATNAVSYLSRQKGRNFQIVEKYLDDPRYFSWGNLRDGGAVMNMDFVFDEIPQKLAPLDYDTFNSYPGKFLIGAFNIGTGETEYFERDALDEHSMILRASCSIPLLFRPVNTGGGLYADGGLGDPIPIRRSIADGNLRNIIVLTQPEMYEKKNSVVDRFSAFYNRKTYPLLARTIENRPFIYNDQRRLCKRLQKEGKALLLYPKRGLEIKRFEKDKEKLRTLYRDGFEQVLSHKNRILDFIREGNAFS